MVSLFVDDSFVTSSLVDLLVDSLLVDSSLAVVDSFLDLSLVDNTLSHGGCLIVVGIVFSSSADVRQRKKVLVRDWLYTYGKYIIL